MSDATTPLDATTSMTGDPSRGDHHGEFSAPDLGPSRHGRRRRTINGLATGVMSGFVLAAFVPLLLVLWSVVVKGVGVVSSADWWTAAIPTNISRFDLASNPTMCGLGFGDRELCTTGAAGTSAIMGMQPAIIGTLITVVGASLLAIPLGVATGVYLNEYGRGSRFARVVTFMTDVMIGVPSVIVGVLVYSMWVLRFGTSGKSAVAASIALAILMLPIIVRSTTQMLALVPDALREASAALGGRTWRTTSGVVVPAAAGGIISGCLLAVARAAGETAPVMFTIGFVATTNWSPFGQNTTLSAQIYSQIQNGGPGATSLAWGAALTLVAIVGVLTLAARLVSKRLVGS